MPRPSTLRPERSAPEHANALPTMPVRAPPPCRLPQRPVAAAAGVGGAIPARPGPAYGLKLGAGERRGEGEEEGAALQPLPLSHAASTLRAGAEAGGDLMHQARAPHCSPTLQAGAAASLPSPLVPLALACCYVGQAGAWLLQVAGSRAAAAAPGNRCLQGGLLGTVRPSSVPCPASSRRCHPSPAAKLSALVPRPPVAAVLQHGAADALWRADQGLLPGRCHVRGCPGAAARKAQLRATASLVFSSPTMSLLL